MGVDAHRKNAPSVLRVAVLTVSTTRTLSEDKSGQWMSRRAQQEGHSVVAHRLVTDERQAIALAVGEIISGTRPDLLLITGGTGLSPGDVTIEAVEGMYHKKITAFSTLFAQLSFEQIDSAAIASRASAGIIGNTALFCLPGSLNACKLACKALIFPEAGHIAGHLGKVDHTEQNPIP
jgi:molybdenum cofactor biosynthesis protein B